MKYFDTPSSDCRPDSLSIDSPCSERIFYKEEFYVPTIFIKESDLRGWCLHIIGQVDKCLVLVSRIVCDATKNSRCPSVSLISVNLS